jgi:hypothetical protein
MAITAAASTNRLGNGHACGLCRLPRISTPIADLAMRSFSGTAGNHAGTPGAAFAAGGIAHMVQITRAARVSPSKVIEVNMAATFLTHAGAALLVPALLTPGLRTECEPDRLTYVSADDRALGRFIAATHDYVAYGKQGAIFNDRAAELFRFQLRISRWLHRYHAAETITDGERAGTKHHGVPAAPGVVAAALPELPDELEYRLAGPHLLLIDRRTRAVVDLLPDAFGSWATVPGSARPTVQDTDGGTASAMSYRPRMAATISGTVSGRRVAR